MPGSKIYFFLAIIIDPRPLNEGDISRSLSLNRAHLEHWEQDHGRIPHGAFVILRSGWAEYYAYPDKFFGFFEDEESQVFPGNN
jgi:kynurenine formamidase